jgi:PRC-barrel domain
MEAPVDHPLPWLRYLNAGDLNDDVEFDGMLVESPTGEKLGTVDGFIIDSESARPYYVVIDAGGWFKSKHFLLPIGHARVNADAADLSRTQIDRFPGFDKDEFKKMSPEAIKRLNDATCQACTVTTVTYSTAEPYTAAWDRPDYAYPDWWNAQATLPDRMGANTFKEMADYEPLSSTRSSDPGYRERVVAAGERDSDRAEADRDMRDPGEPSPHYGGRAQPGDVLGVETGGESTSIGDTAEDENKRRRKAEKDAPPR